jgi:Outer membrane protein beta-barrel domain
LRFSFFVVLLQLFPFLLLGQETTNNQWEVGLSLGFCPFQGDIADQFLSSKGAGPGVNWFVGYHLSPRWVLQGDVWLSSYAANDFDFDRAIRGYSVATTVLGLGLQGQYALTKYSKPDQGWRGSPYISMHLGSLYAEPSVSGLPPQSLDKDVFSTFGLYAGYGLGYRIYNWEGWMVTTSIKHFYTTTDYLDGVSYSANPANKDRVVMGLLSFGKTF